MKRSIAILLLALVGCGTPTEFNETTASLTYNEWQVAVKAFYDKDVAGYWAKYGLPPAARLSDITTKYLEPQTVFAPLIPAFDAERFARAVETRELDPMFWKPAYVALYGGAAPFDAFIQATRSVTRSLDTARLKYGEGSPYLQSYYNALRSGFTSSIVAEKIVGAPTLREGVTDNGEIPEIGCTPRDSSGGEPVLRIEWGGVTDPQTHWPGTKGSCKTAAVGLCASKLGIPGYGRSVSCADWEKAAGEIEAKGGALKPLTNAGYACKSVRACEDAAVRLMMKCDVFQVYTAPGHHMEMVTDMSYAGPGKCNVTTHSWGAPSSHEYEDAGPGEQWGKYSGKTDGPKFKPDMSKGEAFFVACCPTK